MGFFSRLLGFGSVAADPMPGNGPDGSASPMGLDAKSAAAVLAEIDIDTAIAAHENWKLRLQSYLNGNSTENLQADVVCLDDRCDLGKWIYSTGRAKLGSFPGFTALQGHHKMFHYAASNVVALAQAGKTDEAHKMLEVQFAQHSAEVLRDLQHLSAMVREAGEGRPDTRH